MASSNKVVEPAERDDQDASELNLDTAKLHDMSKALARLESEKRGLLENIRILRVRLADEKENQGDVYYYLHKKLDDNYDVISTLERQLMVETADREKAETEYARQIEELEIRRDDELGPLKQKLRAEEEQLNGMQEAAKNKREADANRARLEAEIKKTESTVEEDLNTERRKKLQEKQRVRKQVEDEIAELSSELFSKKEVELADKTVRAKDNNEKLHAALQAKARQAGRMTVMNQGLAFENRSLRNDVDLAKASEAVLEKAVRQYHDLVINLKARLEQEASDAEYDTMEEQELAELEESLASGGRSGDKGDATVLGLDNMSLTSDTPSGAQIIWAGGACGALEYESVDELRVAVESLQRLHAELQEEARDLSARVDESRAAEAARKSGDGSNRDPVASCLLEAAEVWMATSRSCRNGDGDREDLHGTDGEGGLGSLVQSKLVPAPSSSRRSRRDDNNHESFTNSSRRRGGLRRSGDRTHMRTPSRSSDKQEKIVVAGRWSSTGNGDGERQGTPLQEHSKVYPQQSSSDRAENNNSVGGELAAATKTPLRRRELFYYLLDAFSEYQRKEKCGQTTAVHDGNGVGCEESIGGGEPRVGSASGEDLATPVASAAYVDGGGGAADGNGSHRVRNTDFSCVDGAGDGCVPCGSDGVSVSVRTLCDFGIPECRSVSTQTVAKHFPEKYSSVKPPRRLVVNNTFLTSNSTMTNSVQTVSTVRSWGYGAISSDSYPDRRL